MKTPSIPALERAVAEAERDFALSGVTDGMEAWQRLKEARATLAEAQRQVDMRGLEKVLGGKTKVDGRTIGIGEAARLYAHTIAILERHLARSELCRRGRWYAEESLRLTKGRLEHVQRRMQRGQDTWSATAPAVAA